MTYCFILGHNPTLSVAEITRVLVGDFRVVELSAHVLIIESQKELPAEQLQQQLGGTIKIGQIISRINTNFNTNNTNIIRAICDELVRISGPAKRFYFGFSLYSLSSHEAMKKYQLQIKPLAMEIKKVLKNLGLSSRWVSSKKEVLSSVIVQKNKLLTQGAEFCFLIGAKNIYPHTKIFGVGINLARTLSCQEVDEYSYYDFGRPARSMKQGMLPPKLAKIMINLAQAPQSGIILDPFCGVGTVLQEAARLGYQHLIGSDISQQAIDNTKVNLRWLAENAQFSISNFQPILQAQGWPELVEGQANPNLQIFQSDIKDISQKVTPDSIDAIVTEPYLGPIDKTEDSHQISKIISELSDLYLAAFRELKQILKKDRRLVIVFPVFKEGVRLHYLPIMDEVKKQGWQIVNPVPSELRKNLVIKITARDSIIYSRPDQMVLREILVFQH